MLNISEELKTLYKTDTIPLSDVNIPKDLELYFPDLEILIGTDKIVDDSFSLEESLCSNADLVFGSCESAICKIKLADITKDVKGHEFILTQTIDSEHRVPLGVFIVDSVEIEEGLRFKEIIAFDRMTKTDVDASDWYNSLDFPLTLKEFRESLLNHLGIPYTANETLPNDTMLVEKTIEPAEISGRDILKACVEINGAFGHINRQGLFTHIILQDVVHEEIHGPICRELKKEEYIVNPIDKLQIRQEEGDIGAIVGDGTNTYVIEGNFLIFGKTATELEEIALNVFENIEGRTYRPFEYNGLGLPYLEVGDRVEIDGAITSYILKRTLSGMQALKDEYEAQGSKEREQNFGLNKEIIQLKGRFAKVQKDVDGIYTEVGNLEENVSTSIEQLADQLVLKVDDNGKIGLFKLGKNEDGTDILIKADNIVLEGLVTANGNFKILEDGSIETVDGKFKGLIEGGLIRSENFLERDEYGNLILDGQGNPIETGLGTLINLTNGFAKFLGESTYKWLGEDVGLHKAIAELYYGYLRVQNEDASQSIYVTPKGITTNINNVGTGTISFFDNTFKDTHRGITINTKNSPIGLRSEGNSIFLAPEEVRAQGNKMVIDVTNTLADGMIRYGTAEQLNLPDDLTREYATCIRMSSDPDNPSVWVTDGSGQRANLAPIYASNIPKAIESIKISDTALKVKVEGESKFIEYGLTKDSQGRIQKIESETGTIDVTWE